jgi:glutathione S-transferase
MERCTCGCWGSGHMGRRFFTAKEQEEWLETYRDQLKKELAGVEERLKEQSEK